jgi:flagellar biogenesis protein FliO
MQTFSAFALIIPLAFFGISLWILWKFYGALARIGEELSEIKTVLRLRLPPPERPGEP